MMKIIQPAQMVVPKGHYSPGIAHNGVIYVSGQLPLDADGVLISEDITEQVRCCLENMSVILQSGGSSLGQVLKLNIFIADIADWGKVNAVVAELFGTHRPARIVVPVKRLNYGCAIEIDAIATAS
jgi:reactive intermediate/imine deaminase